jgi:hypothetical protein
VNAVKVAGEVRFAEVDHLNRGVNLGAEFGYAPVHKTSQVIEQWRQFRSDYIPQRGGKVGGIGHVGNSPRRMPH